MAFNPWFGAGLFWLFVSFVGWVKAVTPTSSYKKWRSFLG